MFTLILYLLIIRLHIYPGQGIGYARSTEEELAYIIHIAHTTGIILDPVYSGKALYYFINYVIKQQQQPGQHQQQQQQSGQQQHKNKKEINQLFKRKDKILFIHTGGTIGLYDKESEIVPLLSSSTSSSKVSRMKISKP